MSKNSMSYRNMAITDYRFTEYFENEVLRKRTYFKKEWCIHVIENPLKVEPQENNRFRFRGMVPELEGRVLRVIALSDKTTIHNAFPDRGFKK
jgi:hypothetical protein